LDIRVEKSHQRGRNTTVTFGRSPSPTRSDISITPSRSASLSLRRSRSQSLSRSESGLLGDEVSFSSNSSVSSFLHDHPRRKGKGTSAKRS
jgi:hypothetical protein